MGFQGRERAQTKVLPASPYVLLIPHTCSHSDAQCNGISSLDGRKECMLRPITVRKITQPGPIPRPGVPGVVKTYDRLPSPASLQLSQNHPLSRQGVHWQDSKGRQGVRGPFWPAAPFALSPLTPPWVG